MELQGHESVLSAKTPISTEPRMIGVMQGKAALASAEEDAGGLSYEDMYSNRNRCW